MLRLVPTPPFELERSLHKRYFVVHRLRCFRALSGLSRDHFSIKFAMYSIVGAIAFSIDYSIFLAIFSLVGPYVANVLGICAGIAISFTLNSRYNFRRRDAVMRRATKFVAVALFGIALSSVIIALLIHQSLDPRLAKVVAMLVVFTVQFALNALWTFR
jgi:putative flippase GtrA